ncbi:helix-turn-helix transcriptional regulator [Streptomyces sp. R302]|uniref:helix-turn-helix domain-containing protein n=1 Tax=unclassified Streptomyces TaxID=2593676 RepID=UPI00145E7160|nr:MULTISPECIES: helix-turn-helix transcriptional regulator [unclassified Streptomyces]NML55417.1 helix-turn-helix transcriptional regulator [Streptomyces sp. R301]NML80289.1 helix-turn-helix transcriptional regulator [Streptomyces sp. R302]
MRDLPQSVGSRIAATRRARHLTQTALAERAYVSLAMVKALERGARTPSDATLEAIATALDVEASNLLGEHAGTSRRIHAALPQISAILAVYDIPPGPPTRPLTELRAAVAAAVDFRVGAQYARIAEQAPNLLQDTLAHLHATPRPDTARLVVSAARSADAVAYKCGALDLSARLIDLMRWAAAQAENPLVDATVAYVRGETFFGAKAHAAGLRALQAAIDATPPPDGTAAAAARGALHMRAAVIAGRAGDADSARRHLDEAREHSRSVPEGVYQGTAFGPDSVRAHEVSLAVSLGGDHVHRALDVTRGWQPSKRLPAERRSGVFIELARAQLWSGAPDAAFESLSAARQIAPLHTREHPWVKEDVLMLRRLKRSEAEGITRFAEWIGAV